MILEPISMSLAAELFAFESENREYFDSIGLGRVPAYYVREWFDEILEELVEEQELDGHYMYVIRDAAGQIVGRINLIDVTSPSFPGGVTAELGYRIGEDAQGFGYATEAVGQIIELARAELGLNRIVAGTAPHNEPSQRVLENNGFTRTGGVPTGWHADHRDTVWFELSLG